MDHGLRTSVSIACCGLVAGVSIGCSDPMPPDAKPRTAIAAAPELENCAPDGNWLPMTPPVQQFMPLPHPTTECPFYRGGWQNFLIATQASDATGAPALLSYPTIDTTFTSRFKRPANRAYLGDIKQAGQREILIDQNGNSLYYGIHVNEAFRQFIADNDLKTSYKLQAYPDAKKNLFFPAGVAEFKSAWQIVEGDEATIAAQTASYISMKTTVPTLSKNASGNIVEDRDTPIAVTVRLLALHVVFTLPGHPEFIWASFEHSTGTPDSAAIDDKRDLAPIFDDSNPDATNNTTLTTPASTHDFLLYKGGTPVNRANASIAEPELNLVGQKFLVPGTSTPQTTSIYRMFAASKSNTTDPDEAITSLNNNVEALFKANPTDKRGHYRLVGAQWMDKPDFFVKDFPIQNSLSSPFAAPPKDADHPDSVGIGRSAFLDAIAQDGSDSPYSILAGEDRMSSTAMESFTQVTFENCFRCHNTQAINANGVALNDQSTNAIKLVNPGLLNVSHVISQFILEDCNQPENLKPNDDPLFPSAKMAVCPVFKAPVP